MNLLKQFFFLNSMFCLWINVPFQNSESRNNSATEKTTIIRSYVPKDNTNMVL